MTQAKLIGGKNDIREIKSRLVEAGCFRSARHTYAIRVSAVVLGVLLSSAWARIDAAKGEAASSGGKGGEGGGKGVTAKKVAEGGGKGLTAEKVAEVVAKGVLITAGVALCVGSGFILCF
jgi:hypothetical protein